jgi:YidC/Oxa1 family membrane protein insertase
MGVSQVAIQRMTPQSTADPVQAKVMQFMPIMFTFILAWAPSGLVLYWFSNNLVSMGQQMMTNRYLRTQDEKAAEADKAAGKGKKKGKK